LAQRLQHLCYCFQIFLKLFEIERREISEVTAQYKEISKLLERSVGNRQELQKLFRGVSSEAFCNICGYGIRSAPYLRNNAKLLATWKRVGQFIELKHHAVRALPNFEVGETLQHDSPLRQTVRLSLFTGHGPQVTAF